MPKMTSDAEILEGLKPYTSHGVDLTNKKQATSDCPFCGKEGKFSVNAETTEFKCWSCQEKGNALIFVQKLWAISDSTKQDYSDLVQSRGYLDETTLVHWQVVKSATTGEWLVPGYGADGTLRQLYRYVKTPSRWTLFPTPTLGHQLHGVNLYDAGKSVVWLCEGPWDAVCLWEVLSKTRMDEGGEFVQTANTSISLLSDSSVLAVPGCSVFHESWLPLFAGKTVNLMYDSDHPKETQNGVVPPAGYAGMLRVAKMLAEEKEAPKEINLLKWGPEGYDPGLPSGHDLRDALKGTLSERITGLSSLFERMEPFDVPIEEVLSKTGKDGELKCIECSDYRTMVGAWKRAIKWTEGLEHGLVCMLSSVISTLAVGDPLWLKVVSPASSGKTTIAEGIAVARKFVRATDTLRGFTSGYKMPDGSTRDLASELNGMTLVTMDGDTLLQLPTLPNILSEARRLYDGSLNSHFKNATGKDVADHRMTWLLLGTSALRTIDSSELGTRFLDCVMMDRIDDDLEDDVLWMVVNRSDRNLAIQANGKPETRRDPDMVAAMQLTGGYAEFLRNNAQELLSQVDGADDAKRYVTRLGKFVAYMRARPSLKQEESVEREFAARLVSQLWRLAKCSAAVLNRREVDDEIVQRTKRVALDTARGQTLELAAIMHQAGDDGAELRALALRTGRTDDKTRTYMRFLHRIGIVEPHTVTREGFSKSPRWRLTRKLRKLYEDVMGEK